MNELGNFNAVEHNENINNAGNGGGDACFSRERHSAVCDLAFQHEILWAEYKLMTKPIISPCSSK